VNNFSKETFLKFFLSLSLSLFIFLLSQNDVLWMNFWKFLKIPSVLPPFSDFDALNIFLSYEKMGLNPYVENPESHPIHKFLIYPSVWLDITDILNLNNNLNFKLVSFLILFTYFYVLIDFYIRFKSKIFGFFLIVFFFSTSNFLLIERLNVEIILFCLIYFSLVNKKTIIKFFFYFASVALKIFPIFSIFLFIDKKKIFFLALAFSIIYLFMIKEEIALISSNVIEYALIPAYGAVSISKALYYYSMKFGLLINDENYHLFKKLIIILFSFYGLILFLINFSFSGTKKISKKLSIEEKMFLAGGGIFIGTFAISANFDYRLLFLILTFPYFINKINRKLLIIYFLFLILCFNSMLYSGDPYTLSYFLKAVFIYSIKIFIYSLNCFYFGIILNNYIKINFFNLKS